MPTGKYVNCCPCCNGELEVQCNVVVLYSISDDGVGYQDWIREEVFDDGSTPFLVRCCECGEEWSVDEFEATSGGITWLKPKERDTE